ncbi:uncharacterized protein BJ171DRAFT_184352 [Polychytrium aggregatum]|uniref:uncharacterized protein n=1 Tax=Polychytrium aggregatum TaxID=110093 RepID=UPI0022FED6F3|nr:uncharacterized protein BJ171DRAFT_184352 [Polychytrium aggregatum]KAI9202396.1 hypothetical protein BJ171DRAFT_184352 [Polychytrium aggregatum]
MNNIYNSIGRLETYSPLLIPTTSNTPSMSRSGSYAADGPDRPTLAPLRPSDFEKNRRLPKVFPDYPTTTSGVAWLLWTILTGVGWIRKFFDLFHGYMSSDDRGSSENLRLLADVDRAMNRLRKLSECLQELWPALCSIRYNSALYTTKPQASPYLDTIDAESYDMLDHSHPTSLSVEGREQIKSGKRKCVNVDVRVIETERSEAIVQTGEIAILVHISIWLTKQLAGWWACLKAILPWIPDYNFKSIRMLANVVNDVYALLLSLLLLTMFSWFTLLCAALALVLIDVVGAAFISHITRDLHTK